MDVPKESRRLDEVFFQLKSLRCPKVRFSKLHAALQLLYKSNMDLQRCSIKLCKPDLKLSSPPQLMLRSLPFAFSWWCGRPAFPAERRAESPQEYGIFLHGHVGVLILEIFGFWSVGCKRHHGCKRRHVIAITNSYNYMLYSWVVVFLDHRTGCFLIEIYYSISITQCK